MAKSVAKQPVIVVEEIRIREETSRAEIAAAAALHGTPPRLEVVDPTIIRIDDDLLRDRLVYVFGAIDEESAGAVVQQLHWLDVQGRGRVTIYISSPGGELHSTFGLFDVIRSMRSLTVTVGIGDIASGASLLLQAGQVRKMTPRAWLMIHEVSSGGHESTTTKTEDDLVLLKRLQQQMLDIYTERSRVKRDEIAKEWKRKDWWMTAQEALKQGFIDEIMAEVKPTKAKRRR